jgi:signal transduction histidine kinase
MRDTTVKPIRFISAIQEINDRKRQKAKPRRAKEAAGTAERAKEVFLAAVSHEIRAHFHAILGMDVSMLRFTSVSNTRAQTGPSSILRRRPKRRA